jgi:malate synthase
MKDILIKSALTTIMDCEYSVTAVDAADKVVAYSNFIGLMQGSLQVELKKGDKTFIRLLRASLSGLKAVQCCLFIRGSLNDPPCDHWQRRQGIMDGVLTALIAIHDLNGTSPVKNSTTGSINIVKSRMHGPEEVAFTTELFGRVEALLSLPKNTIKVGIMDEERAPLLTLKVDGQLSAS